LGGIYEQYLSFVQVRKGEDKAKSKRKSQGIYYTPKYIVEFIVKETLGEVLEKTKPKYISKIKVLDPACGSGSFLTVAYDTILENVDNRSLFTKFDILKDNIYGVDLDAQAVEIAQLNLLLKVLSQRTKLPTLQHNLRVGNSLISEGETEHRPFNFETEFKEVSEQGGFNVIISNPPYIKEDTNRSAFDGLRDNPYYQGKMDIWTLFACQAIDLLKDGGYFSFIAPSSWIGSAGASIFRKKILSSGEIVKFVDFNDFRVFKDASIQTMIFVFQKKKPRKYYKVQYAKITSKDAGSEAVSHLLSSGLRRSVESSIVYEALIKSSSNDGKSINFSDDTVSEVLDKLEKISNFRLSKGDIGNGIDVLQDFVSERHLAKLNDDSIKKGNGVLVLKNSSVAKMTLNEVEREYLKPYYTTKQINRYLSVPDNEYRIIYADKYFREHVKEFPNLKAHIDRFKKILTSAFAPYGLHRPRDERFFKGQAIFLLRKTMYPAFTYVDFPCYVTRAFLVLKPDGVNLKYLMALLNSKLIYFWLKHKGKKQGEQLQIDKEPLMNIPLLKVDEDEQQRIIMLVDTVMARNTELHKTSANTDKWQSLKAEVAKLEREIDQEVYKFYGLTNEEITTIEQQ
jgi:adenine-specific DNA-methyltransferase